jgi:hypothetical protein
VPLRRREPAHPAPGGARAGLLGGAGGRSGARGRARGAGGVAWEVRGHGKRRCVPPGAAWFSPSPPPPPARIQVGNDAAVLGFVGAPFTLATYIIEGGSSKSFAHTKRMAFGNPEVWRRAAAGRGWAAATELRCSAPGAVVPCPPCRLACLLLARSTRLTPLPLTASPPSPPPSHPPKTRSSTRFWTSWPTTSPTTCATRPTRARRWCRSSTPGRPT